MFRLSDNYSYNKRFEKSATCTTKAGTLEFKTPILQTDHIVVWFPVGGVCTVDFTNRGSGYLCLVRVVSQDNIRKYYRIAAL